MMFLFVTFQPKNIKLIINNIIFVIYMNNDADMPNNFWTTIATPLKPDTTKSLGIKNKLKQRAYKKTPRTNDIPSKTTILVSLSNFILSPL